MSVRTFLISAFSVLGCAASIPEAAGATRQCEALYVWETTGGSLGSSFGEFEAVGSCGSAVPNRCPKRARAAAVDCMSTQWDRRWQHHFLGGNFQPNPAQDKGPPEACVGASIKGYSLEKMCVVKRKTGQHPNSQVVCDQDAHSNNVEKSVLISTAGDLKARLEAEVCCLWRDGTHDFEDNKNIHVRLMAATASSNNGKHCESKRILAPDYKIDCDRVRQTQCKNGV